MGTAQLTRDAFVTPALPLSGQDIAALETVRPGIVDARLAYRSAWIDARLAKRYAVPFGSPPPAIVVGWLADIVTLDLMVARGFNPSSQQDQLIVTTAEEAKAEIKEAADSETGLFDLPLRADTTASGISQGAPMGVADATPFPWIDRQAEVFRGR